MLARALIVLAGMSLFGCDKAEQTPSEPQPASKPADPHDGLKTVTVDQLSTMLAKSQAVPVDANKKGTRDKLGIIPSSVLLSRSGGFDASELPADKDSNLVFYCYNTRCSAAPNAAEHATEAGYRNVSVLPAGITGWVDAGKKVAKPNS